MNTDIQIFNHPEFGTVRTAGTPEQPLFCLVDACKALDLRANHVRSRLDDGVVSTDPIPDNLGRIQRVNFITEDGLYDVILDSRKPSAKKFRKWVTSEVLPSIRKSGGYMVDAPQLSDAEIMARALAIAQDTLSRREQRINQLEAETAAQAQLIEQKDETLAHQQQELTAAAPKVSYYDQTLQSVNSLTTTQVAKSLGMNVGELTEKLKAAGIIYRQSGQWLLHAPYSGWLLHTTRTSTYTRSDGTVSTNIYTVWTEKGRRFITELKATNFNVKQAIQNLKTQKDQAVA